MPEFACVNAMLHCLKCDELQIDGVNFQWGHCPSIYNIRAAIKWKSCPDSRIVPWTYFEDDICNLGNPHYKNLILTDTYHYGPGAGSRTRCTNCGTIIEGTATRITDGYITSVWIYKAGDFDDEADTYLVDADGTLIMMDTWLDHPMSITRCS